MLKAIHYINQFFGQVGGEDAADAKPIFHDNLVGCSMMLNQMVKPDIEVTNTIVCGDNYITNHTDEALKEIFAWLDTKKFDIFFAGPAFMAGRYGVGCGIMCKAVAERYHVPVITSMNEENPGVEEYKSVCYIFKGGRKATFMKDDVTAMAAFAKKIAKGEELLPAAQEGYFPRGIRAEIPQPDGRIAADRVIDMLLKKLKDEGCRAFYLEGTSRGALRRGARRRTPGCGLQPGARPALLNPLLRRGCLPVPRLRTPRVPHPRAWPARNRPASGRTLGPFLSDHLCFLPEMSSTFPYFLSFGF